jgi:hypothetical protein
MPPARPKASFYLLPEESQFCRQARPGDLKNQEPFTAERLQVSVLVRAYAACTLTRQVAHQVSL